MKNGTGGVKLDPGLHMVVPHQKGPNKLPGPTLILFYWPLPNSFTNIRRSNPTCVFYRNLQELSPCVFIPTCEEEMVDDFVLQSPSNSNFINSLHNFLFSPCTLISFVSMLTMKMMKESLLRS